MLIVVDTFCNLYFQHDEDQREKLDNVRDIAARRPGGVAEQARRSEQVVATAILCAQGQSSVLL